VFDKSEVTTQRAKYKHMLTPALCFSPVSREASAKSGENKGPRAQEGHSNFRLKRGVRACKAGAEGCSPGFHRFVRMAKSEKKPPAESLFWLLFVATKLREQSFTP
jgi:hypothetical protein